MGVEVKVAVGGGVAVGTPGTSVGTAVATGAVDGKVAVGTEPGVGVVRFVGSAQAAMTRMSAMSGRDILRKIDCLNIFILLGLASDQIPYIVDDIRP